MEIKLILAQKYVWKFIISDRHSTAPNFDFEIHLDLISVSSLVKHENILILPNQGQKSSSRTPIVTELTQSILKNGFYYPVLATYSKSKKLWIIADGTHRQEAMKELNSRWILGTILKRDTFQRKSWIKVFLSEAPDIEYFLNSMAYNGLEPIKISLKVRDNILHQKGISIQRIKESALTMKELATFQFESNFLCAYRKDNSFVILRNLKPENRLKHLEIIKKIDDNLDRKNKNYLTVSEIEKSQLDFLFLPPPLDSQNDIDYLVQNESLRRVKGSRTVVPSRLIHLPIPFEILQLSREQSIEGIKEIIDNLVETNDFGSIVLSKNETSSFNNSWYDHCLLVGSRRSFFKSLPLDEITKLEMNFDTLKVSRMEQP